MPNRIIDLYERHARDWDQDRGRHLFEKPWLDRFLTYLAPGASVLDLGCGPGEPIDGYLIGRGIQITGVDSSPSMISMCLERFPSQNWLVGDMRTINRGRVFDGILAWDSFFHLCPDDQRSMFGLFRRHAAPGAVLMFTSGHLSGSITGQYRGEELYHASLSVEEYQRLLEQNGFDVLLNIIQDPECGHHTVWLARLK
jgi:cyclopropane fatty-acyl-phospholipid synthase-like methyltransferase